MRYTVRRDRSSENGLHQVRHARRTPPVNEPSPLQRLHFLPRTGKRTRWGLLMDGWNSAIRYYKNNFSDGFRQVDMSSTHKQQPCMHT